MLLSVDSLLFILALVCLVTPFFFAFGRGDKDMATIKVIAIFAFCWLFAFALVVFAVAPGHLLLDFLFG